MGGAVEQRCLLHFFCLFMRTCCQPLLYTGKQKGVCPVKKTMKLRSALWLWGAAVALLSVCTVLLAALQPLGWTDKASDDAFILDVPYISQKGLLPTGCEIVSALMVLRHYEYDITADAFIDQYLDKGEFYTDDEGRLYGVHPARAFAGDPRSENGYGCYAPVIVNLLNRILKNG